MDNTLVARFLAASPSGLCDWPYQHGFRFLDGGDLCTLESDGRMSREPVGAALFSPRLGGGMLIVRGSEIALTARDSGRDLAIFTTLNLDSDVRVTAGACDPDGAFFVADSTGTLHQIEPTSKRIRTAMTGLGVITAITWSADGDWAFIAGSEGIYRHSYDPIIGFGAGELWVSQTAVSLAPDLCGGIYLVADGTLWHIDRPMAPLASWPVSRRVTSVAATLDGVYFTVVDPDGRAELWRLALGDSDVDPAIGAGNGTTGDTPGSWAIGLPARPFAG